MRGPHPRRRSARPPPGPGSSPMRGPQPRRRSARPPPGPGSSPMRGPHPRRRSARPPPGPGSSPPPGDPVVMALADAARRFALPLAALEELVEGCEWDLAGRSYETFEDLLGYCRRVAGSIGRLSLAVYGSDDHARAESLADSLGVALQLTNILRDLVEDRDVYGRVYVPQEDLARFGVGPDLKAPAKNLTALVCYEAARASEWYSQGLSLLPLLDWRSRACTAAMAGIYRRLLQQIQQAPASVLAKRVSLPPVQKATVAATALLKGAA